jgi:hypothetical protein
MLLLKCIDFQIKCVGIATCCFSRCFDKTAGLTTHLFIHFRKYSCCPLEFYIFWYYLTPRSRVLLENLAVSQLVKKFPAVYGTRRFVTVFTTILSQMNPVHILPSYLQKIHFTIVLHLCVGFRSGLFPSDILNKIWFPLFLPLYMLHASPISSTLFTLLLINCIIVLAINHVQLTVI